MTKEGRLHIRLSQEIVDQLKDYAKRHHTTVTALVQQTLLDLFLAEESTDIEPGEQI